MSLFASSFETGVTAGPSSIPLKHASGANRIQQVSKGYGKKGKDKNMENKKRKRQQEKQGEKISSTEKNLKSLMSQLDREEIKDRSASQPMGSGKRKKQRHDQKQQQPPSSSEKHQHQRKNGELHDKRANRSDDKVAFELDTTKRGGRPEPVELPLSHIGSAKKGKRKAGSEEGLTTMQQGMKTKLEQARFRWINEQLYSTSSEEAVAMMKKDPKIFSDYHSTHRILTAAWPSPPLEHIIKLLRPLPERTVIVDLGCGDAGLAKALVPEGKIVLSYDLVGDSDGAQSPAEDAGGWVTEADFLHSIPLPGRPGGSSSVAVEKAHGSEIVDVAVCCLSLMGTNWVGGIYEACRVLKQSGTLHIAEVTSRFVDVDTFVEIVESFGFELEDKREPTTHFTLFRFTKTSAVPEGPVRGDAGWAERIRQGEQNLRACVYKKR